MVIFILFLWQLQTSFEFSSNEKRASPAAPGKSFKNSQSSSKNIAPLKRPEKSNIAAPAASKGSEDQGIVSESTPHSQGRDKKNIEEFDEVELAKLRKIADSWEDFKKQSFEELGVPNETIKALDKLREDYQHAAIEDLEVFNATRSISSRENMGEAFREEVDKPYKQQVKEILTNEIYQELEMRKVSFDLWVAEQFPEHPVSTKGLNW